MPEETTPAPTVDKHFAAGVSDNPPGGPETQDDPSFASEEKEQRTYTREEYEKGVQRRLARQERKLREELKAEAEEEARKARMDETERLRVERDQAYASSEAAIKAAHEKLVLTEAKAQAASMGVSQDSLKYISRLVDISDVDVDVDGTPDEEAIREAVEQVLKDVPALAAKPEIVQEEQDPRQSPIMPMGRDRTPDASRSPGKGGTSALDLFNQRLKQRVSAR